MSEQYLGKLLVAKTAQGKVNFVGVCQSYCEAPTVGIRCLDGTWGNWRADMCEIVEMDERAATMILRTITKRDPQPQPDPEMPCCDTSPNRYVCTLPESHTMHTCRHEAWGDGKLLESWPIGAR